VFGKMDYKLDFIALNTVKKGLCLNDEFKEAHHFHEVVPHTRAALLFVPFYIIH